MKQFLLLILLGFHFSNIKCIKISSALNCIQQNCQTACPINSEQCDSCLSKSQQIKESDEDCKQFIQQVYKAEDKDQELPQELWNKCYEKVKQDNCESSYFAKLIQECHNVCFETAKPENDSTEKYTTRGPKSQYKTCLQKRKISEKTKICQQDGECKQQLENYENCRSKNEGKSHRDLQCREAEASWTNLQESEIVPFSAISCSQACQDYSYTQEALEVIQINLVCLQDRKDFTNDSDDYQDFSIDSYNQCVNLNLVECPLLKTDLLGEITDGENHKYNDLYYYNIICPQNVEIYKKCKLNNKKQDNSCEKCNIIIQDLAIYHDNRYPKDCFTCNTECLDQVFYQSEQTFDSFIKPTYLQCSQSGHLTKLQEQFTNSATFESQQRCLKQCGSCGDQQSDEQQKCANNQQIQNYCQDKSTQCQTALENSKQLQKLDENNKIGFDLILCQNNCASRFGNFIYNSIFSCQKRCQEEFYFDILDFKVSQYQSCLDDNLVSCPVLDGEQVEKNCDTNLNEFYNCYQNSQNYQCQVCQNYLKLNKNDKQYIKQCSNCSSYCLNQIQQKSKEQVSFIFNTYMKHVFEQCSQQGKIFEPISQIQGTLISSEQCILYHYYDQCLSEQQLSQTDGESQIQVCKKYKKQQEQIISNSAQCQRVKNQIQQLGSLQQLIPYGYFLCIKSSQIIDNSATAQLYNTKNEQISQCIVQKGLAELDFTFAKFNFCLITNVVDCPMTKERSYDYICESKTKALKQCFYDNVNKSDNCKECQVYEKGSVNFKSTTFYLEMCRTCMNDCLNNIPISQGNVFDDFKRHALLQCSQSGQITSQLFKIEASIYSAQQCKQEGYLNTCEGKWKPDDIFDDQKAKIEKCKELQTVQNQIIANSPQCQKVTKDFLALSTFNLMPYPYILCQKASLIKDESTEGERYRYIQEQSIICYTKHSDQVLDFTLKQHQECISSYVVECPHTSSEHYDKVCDQKKSDYYKCFMTNPKLYECIQCQNYLNNADRKLTDKYTQNCQQCNDYCLGKQEEGNVFDDYIRNSLQQCSEYGFIKEKLWSINTTISDSQQCIQDNKLQNCSQKYEGQSITPETETKIKLCTQYTNLQIELIQNSQQCQRALAKQQDPEALNQPVFYEYLLCEKSTIIKDQQTKAEIYNKFINDRFSCDINKYEVVLEHTIQQYEDCLLKYRVVCPALKQNVIIGETIYDNQCKILDTTFNNCFNTVTKPVLEKCNNCQNYLNRYKDSKSSTYFLRDCYQCTQQCLGEKKTQNNVFSLYIYDALLQCSQKGQLYDKIDFKATKESYNKCLEEKDYEYCEKSDGVSDQEDTKTCKQKSEIQKKIINNSSQCTNAMDSYIRTKYDSPLPYEYIICRDSSRVDREQQIVDRYKSIKEGQLNCMKIEYKPQKPDYFSTEDVQKCIIQNCATCSSFEKTCNIKQQIWKDCLNNKDKERWKESCYECNEQLKQQSEKEYNYHPVECKTCRLDCKDASKRISVYKQIEQCETLCNSYGKIPDKESQKVVNSDKKQFQTCMEQFCKKNNFNDFCVFSDGYEMHDQSMEMNECQYSFQKWNQCINSSSQCSKITQLSQLQDSDKIPYSLAVCEQSCFSKTFSRQFQKELNCRQICFKNKSTEQQQTDTNTRIFVTEKHNKGKPQLQQKEEIIQKRNLSQTKTEQTSFLDQGVRIQSNISSLDYDPYIQTIMTALTLISYILIFI